MNGKGSIPPEGAADAQETVRAESIWLRGWWKVMDQKVGIMPLPVYLLMLGTIAYFVWRGNVPTELSMSLAVLAVGGFTCAWVGGHIPLIQHIGGAAIFAAFVPSALTHYHLIPAVLVTNVTAFVKGTYFFYIYVAVVVVGSIISMDRAVLIVGAIKMFLPMALGSILAALAGLGVGLVLGMDMKHTFFYLVVPVMSGGLSEGAIPLSIGYSDFGHLKYEDQFAQLMPVVMFGSLMAIMLSGLMNFLGKKFPHLSGEGNLVPRKAGEPDIPRRESGPMDIKNTIAAGYIAIALYLVGLVYYRATGWPAPLTMLFLAVIVKLLRVIPPKMEQGFYVASRFFTTGVTYPVLFAFGVALTPWDKLVAMFTAANCAVIFSVVATMMVTGFATARWIKVYPIEMTILNACHCSHGTAGDVAILTAANRIEMMPFAQIATRLGGLVTVTLALIALAKLT